MLTNCATIVSKSSYPVTINSNPQGLSYVVTDLKTNAVVTQGTTPQQVTLRAGAGYFKAAKYRLDVKKGGRLVATQELQATMDGWYIGNVLFGGIIGLLIVDPITGAMYKFPKDITVGAPSVASMQNGNQSLQVASIESLTPAQRKQLVKI